MRFKLYVLLIIIAGIGDILTTLLGISRNGINWESNPIALYLMNQIGILDGLVLLKALSLLAGILFMYLAFHYSSSRSKLYINYMTYVIVIISFGIVVWNVFNI